MLANILPGFRHTRTPLIAGVLWLLIGWIVLGDSLVPSEDGNFVERRIHDLVTLAGRPTLFAVLGVAAILVGGLIPSIPLRKITGRIRILYKAQPYRAVNQFFGLKGEFATAQGGFELWLNHATGNVTYSKDWSFCDRSDCPPSIHVWSHDARRAVEANGRAPKVGRQVEVGQRTVSLDEDVISGLEAGDWLHLLMVPEAFREELVSELPRRLQIEQSAMYNDYDRVRSEAELRAAIMLPLLLLIGLLVSVTPWWALALVVPIWLLRQGVRAQIESEQILQDATRFGAINSSSVQFVRSLGTGQSK